MVAAEEDTRALYAVLGVDPDAAPADIKGAYRRLALQYHPDKCKGADEASNEKFARLAFAYEILGDAQRRKRYDLTGEIPQNDAAMGRTAFQTFFTEYVKSAPKLSRRVTQADMSLHAFENYEILEVDGKGVPEYMRRIVMIGLGYLVAVVENMQEKDVVLMRHFVMDQMYLLMAYTPPLDNTAFEDRGYIITYWDDPLQSGIKATWTDTNRLDKLNGRVSDRMADMKIIDAQTMEQRRLAAIEWRDGPSTRDLGPAASTCGPPVVASIPGSGKDVVRVRLGLQELLKTNADMLSQSVHTLRRSLERILDLAENDMDSWGPSKLCSLAMEVMDEAEEETDAGGVHMCSDDDF